jgi:hypothetical protein
VITSEQLFSRFPELENIPTAVVSAVLSDVHTELNGGSAFGDRAEQAQAYLAAHYLTLMKLAQRGAAGAVSSETKTEANKSMTVSYKTPSGADMLSQTFYGQMFARLKDGAVDVVPALWA